MFNFLKNKDGKYQILEILLALIFILLLICMIIFRDKINLGKVDFSKEKIYSLKLENKENLSKVYNNINIIYIGKNGKDVIDGILKKITDINPNIKYIDKENSMNLSDEIIYILNMDTMEKDKKRMSTIVIPVEGVYEKDDRSGFMYFFEDKIVAAIKRITEDENKNKVGILQNIHDGELKEFDLLYNKLYLRGYNLEKVDAKNNIPKEFSKIIISAPTKDLTDEELKNLLEFGKNGGNFYISFSKMLDNQFFKNYNTLFNEYGFNVESKYILETDVNRYTENIRTKEGNPDTIVDNRGFYPYMFKNHDITRNLYQTSEKPFFANAIPIVKLNDDELNKKNVKITVLAKTSDKAILKNEMTEEDITKKEFNEENLDKKENDVMIESEKKYTVTEENKEITNVSRMLFISNVGYILGNEGYKNMYDGKGLLELAGNQRLIYAAFEYLDNKKVTEGKLWKPTVYNQKEISKENKIKLNIINYGAIIIILSLGIYVFYANVKYKK